MDIKGAVVLITGANRGIGKAFVNELIKAGAAKVYAAVRNPEKAKFLATGSGKIITLQLDITESEQVEAAAQKCSDVNILINNAGVLTGGSCFEKTLEGARKEMETNYFGTLSMARAFAPVLQKNGGGAMINICSIASHVDFPVIATYSASKAAEWSITKSLRSELAAQNTRVIGVYPGPIDTDMTADMDMEKAPPEQVARKTIIAIRSDKDDVFPDEMSDRMYHELRQNPEVAEKQAAELLPAAEA